MDENQYNIIVAALLRIESTVDVVLINQAKTEAKSTNRKFEAIALDYHRLSVDILEKKLLDLGLDQ